MLAVKYLKTEAKPKRVRLPDVSRKQITEGVQRTQALSFSPRSHSTNSLNVHFK